MIREQFWRGNAALTLIVAPQTFYVNIADPAQIVLVDARRAERIARAYPIPSAGPHGLDLDLSGHRLFCACDSGALVTLDARSGRSWVRVA